MLKTWNTTSCSPFTSLTSSPSLLVYGIVRYYDSTRITCRHRLYSAHLYCWLAGLVPPLHVHALACATSLFPLFYPRRCLCLRIFLASSTWACPCILLTFSCMSNWVMVKMVRPAGVGHPPLLLLRLSHVFVVHPLHVLRTPRVASLSHIHCFLPICLF